MLRDRSPANTAFVAWYASLFQILVSERAAGEPGIVMTIPPVGKSATRNQAKPDGRVASV